MIKTLQLENNGIATLLNDGVKFHRVFRNPHNGMPIIHGFEINRKDWLNIIDSTDIEELRKLEEKSNDIPF